MNWLTLLIVGVLIYAVTLLPPFPASWTPFARFIGGFLVFLSIVVLVLGLLGVRLP